MLQLDGKADRYKVEFEQISKTIKKEIIRLVVAYVDWFSSSLYRLRSIEVMRLNSYKVLI